MAVCFFKSWRGVLGLALLGNDGIGLTCATLGASQAAVLPQETDGIVRVMLYDFCALYAMCLKMFSWAYAWLHHHGSSRRWNQTTTAPASRRMCRVQA